MRKTLLAREVRNNTAFGNSTEQLMHEHVFQMLKNLFLV